MKEEPAKIKGFVSEIGLFGNCGEQSVVETQRQTDQKETLQLFVNFGHSDSDSDSDEDVAN